jgi:DNA helicase HerA-like ATPase
VYETGNLVFAVDEIDLFTSPNFLPRHLDRIVSLGRHRNIRFYCATRRPKEIPPLIRAQAGTVISFQQTEPLDLEWCKAVMGSDAENLPTLPQYQAFEWSDSAPAQEPVDVPERPALQSS